MVKEIWGDGVGWVGVGIITCVSELCKHGEKTQ